MPSPSFNRILPNEAISAFNGEGEMVMVFGLPTTDRFITLADIQQFVPTLEKAIDEEPNLMQKIALGSILSFFMATEDLIHKKHEAFVQEAQDGNELQEYLMNYAKFVKEAQ